MLIKIHYPVVNRVPACDIRWAHSGASSTGRQSKIVLVVHLHTAKCCLQFKPGLATPDTASIFPGQVISLRLPALGLTWHPGKHDMAR